MKKHSKIAKGVFPAVSLASRPVHNIAVANAKKTAELNRKHPEPMTLMHKREKELDKYFSYKDAAGHIIENLYARRKPEITFGLAEKAAKAMADWDNSDPFAYGRTFLHVKQDYVNGIDIVKEMSQRTTARRAAKAREVDNAKSR